MSSMTATFLITAFLADASGLEKRLWEVQVRQFETLDQQQVYPPNSVLFFGSSSIRRWDSIAEDMAPFPVIQRGYGGARLSDAVGYVERVVYPHEFDALVLFVANDLQGLRGDRTPSEVVELFDELLKKVRRRFPDKPVVWVEVTPTPSRWHAYSQIQEAAKGIEAACLRDENAYYLQTADAFLGTSNDGRYPRTELFKSDGLHLNEAGYAIWSAIIRRQLDAILHPSPQTVETLKVPVATTD